jgi:hypothetical protein
MYHPGVWVKNVLIETAAKKVDGVALHVAVDTDAPKHLELRWPGNALPVSDDPRLYDGDWSGLVRSPSPRQIDLLKTAFDQAAAGWSFRPNTEPFFQALSAGKSEMLPRAILDSTAAVDRALGTGDRRTVVLTDALASAGYRAFVHHIAASAEQFAADYNAALADYRTENGIKTASRPMPDLVASADRIELPFWLDNLAAQSRTRAFAVRKNGHWALDAATPFAFDPAADAHAAAEALGTYLQQAKLRLSPRALTLTMFLRLLLVDQFVHGIGGGRYDQVSDRVIERFFGIAAPAFCVTTATLYFPTAGERNDVCMPCLKSEGHALKHALLGEQKQAYLQHIAAAPRKSPQRRASYVAMHKGLAEAFAGSERVPAWRHRFAEAIEQLKADGQIFDRELFYAIQPRERLTAVIEQYRIAFE